MLIGIFYFNFSARYLSVKFLREVKMRTEFRFAIIILLTVFTSSLFQSCASSSGFNAGLKEVYFYRGLIQEVNNDVVSFPTEVNGN